MTTHDTEAALTAAGKTEILETAQVETPNLAWSTSDESATEIVDYRPSRRRWVTAVMAVLIAAGGAGGAAYTWQHDHQAAAPKPAPSVASAPPKPTPPQDPDSRYAALYRSRGGRILPGHEKPAAAEAREACQRLSSESPGQLINDVMDGSPGVSRYSAAVFVYTATDVFCPQYASQH